MSRRLAALLAALLLAGNRPSAAEALDRPVVVAGQALDGLLGEPIGSLRLLRWSGDGFVPIPFQIDPRERLARPGRRARRLYVLGPSGSGDALDARPLAPDDELVFMRSDLGPPPPAGRAPAGSRKGALIEMAGGGAAALFAFDAPPVRSTRRYLRYVAAADRIEARSYALAFSRSRPAILDTLRLYPEDAAAPDLLDRVKIRVRGTLLLALPFSSDENDLQTRIEGVRAGPVRVVRVCRNRVPLMAGFRSPWVEEAQIFYPDGFEFPLWLSKSPAMSRLMTHLSFRVGPDWSPAALGMRVRIAGSGVTFTVDGRMDDAERTIGTEGAAWSILFGERGGIFSGLAPEIEDAAAARPPFRLRYRDDERSGDAPEEYPGEIGALAYEFPEAAGLPAGEYRWAVRTRVVRSYAPGDENALLEALPPASPRRVIAIPADARASAP